MKGLIGGVPAGDPPHPGAHGRLGMPAIPHFTASV